LKAICQPCFLQCTVSGCTAKIKVMSEKKQITLKVTEGDLFVFDGKPFLVKIKEDEFKREVIVLKSIVGGEEKSFSHAINVVR
jgi:hypothetical protein